VLKGKGPRLTFIVPPVLMVALLGLYALWYEPSSLRAVNHVIALDAKHRLSQEPLRIAVISDVHGGAPYIGEAKIDKIVALANGAKPDLILLTGDYVTKGVIGGTDMPIETITAKLQRLSAPLGVFAVLGNHDRWRDAGRTIRALEKAGIPVLENMNVRLKRNGEVLYLVGVSDFTSGPRDILGALTDVPVRSHAICFTHSPDVFIFLPPECALTIGGHTHGGQVRLPFIGRPIVPSLFGQRYAAGLVFEQNKYLFVSTGIGTSIIPVRFGVPPEVSILEVH
jgi:predicted MPP superfamily phosphohydrolase